MLELRCDLNLPLKSLPIHARREVGRQHLDHDLAAERVLRSREDAAHPAPDQLVIDPVGGRERCGKSFAEGVGHSERSGRRWSVGSFKLRGLAVTRNGGLAAPSSDTSALSHRFTNSRFMTDSERFLHVCRGTKAPIGG
jgi:hypothetical protein